MHSQRHYAGARVERSIIMHILMISDVYFPRINGVSTSIRTFRNELINLGHQITLIAPQYLNNDCQEDWIIRIPAWTVPLDPEDRIMRYKFISTLTSELSGRKFDLLHIQTPFMAHYAGVALSKALKLPRVVTYHTHFEEYFHHYLPWLPRSILRYGSRLINRLQCNDVDAVIVPSLAMLEILQNYGINRPVEIIATGIDQQLFTPGNGQSFRQKHNIDPARPVLVHIGRVAHEKNIDFLLYMLIIHV
jgi:glycosyltransferase involved in cell wall biosynthesis